MAFPSPPRILFVCTANVNRSPMAEYWARHFFEQRFVAADVKSAGVIAIDYLGDPGSRRTYENHPFSRAAAFAVEVMNAHGVDLTPHRTQRATAGMVEWADAVVVMEPLHRESLLETAPGATNIQGLWEHFDPPASHVWDPQGRSLEDYRASCVLIRDAVERFVAAHLQARRRR